MSQQPSDEALARGLVVACLPEIEARLITGQPYRATLVAILEAQSAGWREHHGEAVARRAAEILERLGPATALTPYGLARFLAEGPVSAIATPDPRRGIPSTPPRRGIQGSPPREAIAGRSYWRSLLFWRRPSSIA